MKRIAVAAALTRWILLVFAAADANAQSTAPAFVPEPVSDVLISAVNGLGLATSFAYKPLTDATIYADESTASSPRPDLQGPIYVVAAMSTGGGAGAIQTSRFAYGGGKVDALGRGFLGFRWMEWTDQTALRARFEHRQDWPYAGLPSLVKKIQPSGAMLSETTNTYGCISPASGATCAVVAGNRYFPFLSQSVEAGNDLSGAALPAVTRTNTYDGFGNATSVTVSTGDGYSRTTTNTYVNDTTNWLLGRLIRSTVQRTAP